ncbi:hypothetical protein L7F22_020675 [Adiantum nelumboides]|nr:hypothetical protein [Adiantum nelumboides]
MADHLSRITNGEALTGVDDDLPDTSLFMVETIPEWSEKIINFLVNGFPPKELCKDVAQRLIKECEPFSLIAGTLYKLGKDDILRRCAREDEYLYILQEAHMGVVERHFSDDLIIVGDSETKIQHIKGLLKKEFEMKDLGELRYFLGLEVIPMTEGIWLFQRQYALDMLSKYGMADYKPISMPLDHHDRWSTSRSMFTLGSVAITWSSKKQPTVALFSTEVEYRGVAVSTCEVAWLRKLLMDLRLQV